ncbi:hypothetical protein BLA29_007243 [Euroglyphus maynei]|uniref:Uncharacterized protein n=1 Tax=Euroglyphus maynei TaxID=6958 RepID=A0A1Y3BV51_EURMA|nr:hypothetical protein BLA29_007243 [Euroglyphus maynei]
MIIVAHSNGMFGIYKWAYDLNIEQIRQIITGAKMLTTIDDSFVDNHLRIAIGSSCGKLLYYSIDDLIEECQQSDNSVQSIITDDSSPIWCLKMIHFKIIESKIEQNLIFTGSEDSIWRIIACNSQKLTELFKNCDSSSGVTSIELFRMNQIDSKIISIILLVGSYDEYLRIYSIDLEFDHIADTKILRCGLQQKIHIEGGGIWRIRANNIDKFTNDKNIILISAMHAGAYWLTLEIPGEHDHDHHLNINYKMNKFYIGNLNDYPMDKDPRHLVYGIASNHDQSRILIASFYAKKSFLYRIPP